MKSRLPTGCLVLKGKTWWCQWKHQRKPYARSLGTPVKVDAQAAMKKLMASVAGDIINGCYAQKYGTTGRKPKTLGVQAPLPDEPLDRHVEAYLADLKALGRDDMYVYFTGRRLTRLCSECGWKTLKDITALAFMSWRSRQTSKAPKTVNDYLSGGSAFLAWMQKYKYIESNPLAAVDKVETRGREVRIRRAYTSDELRRLLAISSPDRQALYLMAVFSGLRRGELRALRWGDLVLDGPTPCVRVRASISKNHKDAVLGLHPDVVKALLKIRLPLVAEETLVFPEKLRSDTFQAELTKAGITRIDPRGRRLDFHCLRHTLATTLAIAGVQPRVAMEVMRHSDMRLTQKVYTDASLLPTLAAVSSLPSLVNEAVPVPTNESSTAVSDDDLERSCKALLKELERRRKAS